MRGTMEAAKDVPSAFAGLLVYDVLCLTAARRMLEGFDAHDGCVPPPQHFLGYRSGRFS